MHNQIASQPLHPNVKQTLSMQFPSEFCPTVFVEREVSIYQEVARTIKRERGIGQVVPNFLDKEEKQSPVNICRRVGDDATLTATRNCAMSRQSGSSSSSSSSGGGGGGSSEGRLLVTEEELELLRTDAPLSGVLVELGLNWRLSGWLVCTELD